MKKWRESTDGPGDGPGWLVAARLWRQAGVPDSAVQGLRRASTAGGLPSGLLSLEAARTAFLAGRPDAAGAYWEACERPAPAVLDEYWRDFVALATPAEAEEWAGLDSLSADARSAAACAMLRRAWAKRAVGSGSSVADRLAVHYERLRYARQHYYIVGSTGSERLGPRTRLLSVQVGRVRGVGLDDRGLLYVRFGPPDRTASFSGVQNEARRMKRVNLEVSPECYDPNVTWAYDFPDGPRLYHLSSLEGAANWWLMENLYDVYRCGDPAALISSSATTVLTPAAGGSVARIGEIAWLVLPDLYLSRSGLDASYARLSHRIVTSAPAEDEGIRSVNGALGLQQEFAEERQTNFEMGEEMIAGVIDRPGVVPELSLIHATLQFRTPGRRSGEWTRVWANALVGGDELEAEAARDDDRLEYEVAATFSALDENGELHQRAATFRAHVRAKLQDEAGIPVLLSLDLAPGEYEFSVVVRDANDTRQRPAGNWTSDSLTVRRYDGRLPQLSDIAFAPDSGGSWNPVPGVSLPLTPMSVTDDSGNAWLYVEAYGLSPRGEYTTEVRMEPRDQGEAFTLTYSGAPPTSAEEAVHRLFRLELGDSDPGDYVATVTVTDALGRRSLPTQTNLVVRDR